MDNDIKKLIGTKINEGLAVRGKQQKELAEYLGIKDNVVSYFCKGTRAPNHEQIIKIAEFLNTSTDFLYDFTHVIDKKEPIVREICEYTGLSEKAVDVLHGLVENSSCTQISLFNDTFSTLSIINSFFENGNDAFFKKIFELKYESEKSLNVLLGYLNRTFIGTTAYEDMKLSYLYLQVMDTFKETLDSIVPNYQKYEELKSENSAYLKKCADEIEEIFKSFEIKVGENNEQG